MDFDQFEAMLGGFSRTCQRCSYVAEIEKDLLDHDMMLHWDLPNERNPASEDGKELEEDIMCYECFTHVPRSHFNAHSKKHELGLSAFEKNDGRGGRAELSTVRETYPDLVRVDPVKRPLKPLRKFRGSSSTTDREASTFANAEVPESVWNAGDTSQERKKSIEDLRKKGPHRGERGQLGMEALGPFAFEEEMPQRIRDILEKDGKPRVYHKRTSVTKVREALSGEEEGNFASGVVPVVAQLLAQSYDTAYAYLCDPSVIHIHKLKKEGAFCGYRNTQMFSSYLVSKKIRGYEQLDGRIPTIFDIQEHIEHAWDNGFNVNGRIETGGVRGTRKYIGTPEVEAMMHYLNIDITTSRYKTDLDAPGYVKVLSTIEGYFKKQWAWGRLQGMPKSKVRMTNAPPIYFQHSGHSFTVIGFEKLKDGTSQLIAFDPALSDESSIIRWTTKGVPTNMLSMAVDNHLRRYRKTVKYLKKHQIFELLALRKYPGGIRLLIDIDGPFVEEDDEEEGLLSAVNLIEVLSEEESDATIHGLLD